MSLKYTDQELELVIRTLAKLYYQATPVERYKDFSGWYQGALVVDRNNIDYEVWRLTGLHLEYYNMPTRNNLDTWTYKDLNKGKP